MTQQAEQRRRDRSSLQELAKLAQTPPPPSVTHSDDVAAKSSGPLSSPAASNPLVWPSTPNVNQGPWSGADSDSGMVDLKAISQPDAAKAQDRAKGTPLASEGLFDDPPAPAPRAAAPVASSVAPATVPSPGASAMPMPSSHAAVPAVSSAAPAVPATSGLVDIASITAKPREEKKSKAGVVLGMVAALATIAAGAFLFVQHSHKQAEVAAAPPPAVVAPKAVETAAPTPPAQETAPAAPVAEATQPEPEPVAAAKTTHHTKGKPGAKVAAAEPAAPAPAPAGAVADAKEAQKGAAGFAGTLKDEMTKRVGGVDESKEVKPSAEDNTVRGTQPKPSQGQVQGAIGAVLMKARECLGPDDAVSKANVVFASSGAVQSVSVSGGAAGKPAEACIKAALGKAKVPAFADPTYSFPVTVRPL